MFTWLIGFLSIFFISGFKLVKIGSTCSDWLSVQKGAPQGSQFGPFAFNIFTNDLLRMLMHECNIYNYTDDNTILYFEDNLE